MPLIKQRKDPPSWGKRYARSFAEQVPGVAGNVLYQALGGLVKEQFTKAAEKRRIAAQKEEELRRNERLLAKESRRDERSQAKEGRREGRRRSQELFGGSAEMAAGAGLPGEAAEILAKREGWRAPPTLGIPTEAAPAKAAVPGKEGTLGLAAIPGQPAVEGRPELPGVPARKGLGKGPFGGSADLPAIPGKPAIPARPAIAGIPATPGTPDVPGKPAKPALPGRKVWEPGTPGWGLKEEEKTPEAFAGRFRERMEELGPEEKKEAKLTAKQREARDPKIRKAQLNKLWDRLMFAEKKLNAEAQARGHFTSQDRQLREAIDKSKERLNPFVFGEAVPPMGDYPTMEELPYFSMTGGRGGGGGGGRPGSQMLRPPKPAGMTQSDWIGEWAAIVRAGKAKNRTMKQIRQDYRERYGK